MEAVIESRKIVMRIPTDGGGRLVIELNKEEAAELGALLTEVSQEGIAHPCCARSCGRFALLGTSILFVHHHAL